MLRYALLLAMFVCASGVMDVEAQNITADVVQLSTPVYRPEAPNFSPALGTYTYEISWQGIPAAEAKITVRKEGDTYHVVTTARTYPMIALLYNLRYRSEAVLAHDTFLPKRFSAEQRENSKRKTVEVTFGADGEIHSERSLNNGQPKVMRFNSNNFTLEPYSAAFLARSLEWKKGQSREFDTFNGKSRYLVTLTAEEITKIEIDGVMRDAWVISPVVKNLTDSKSDKKLRKAKIYVTADSQRDVVKLVSSVFIGSVTTEMTSFAPLDPGQRVMQTAQKAPM
jgi:hypothetical protein